MSSHRRLTVRTLSPLRSPISADSERRAADAVLDSSVGLERQKIMPDSEMLESFVWPWANGYGTLDHDNLPVFFQPFACYNVKVDISTCSEKLLNILKEHSGEIEACCLYLYDDTVALLQFDVSISEGSRTVGDLLESKALDGALSECTKSIYRDVIYPEFRNYANKFGKKGERRAAGLNPPFNDLRNPNELTIFRDAIFTAENAPDSYVLWTGRYIAVPLEMLDGELGDSLCCWASYSGAKADLLEKRQCVGSGNILILSDDLARDSESWFRGLSICQLYNGILSIYGGILKSSYSDLNEFNGVGLKKRKKLHTLMSDITRTLDHLEFTRLEFNDALVGVQAGRSRVVEVVCGAWKLEDLIKSALERTDLIRSRISRLLEARKTELNRSVELILTGIGGVALIDLFISLTTASRVLGEDDIPGLLDAFLWMQPDGSIALSTLLLLAISGYIYQAKR